jgi:hypothetical protein
MTPRTPQCEVFWSFNSSSKFSGVPEDSKFPLLGVWASPSHLAQSGVATELLGDLKGFGTFHLIPIGELVGYNEKFQPQEVVKVLKEVVGDSSSA